MAGIERAEPHGPVALGRVVAEQRAPTGPAEELREALLRLPRPDVLLARDDPQRLRGDSRLRGGGRARAPLAAGAVAVARAQRLTGELEADGAAQAAAGDGAQCLSPFVVLWRWPPGAESATLSAQSRFGS